MALQKWEEPSTVTALRGFLGFTNYYSAYVKDYAEIVADLQDLLKMDKKMGKKGSKVPVLFKEKQRTAFRTIKERLTEGVSLHTLPPIALSSSVWTPVTGL